MWYLQTRANFVPYRKKSGPICPAGLRKLELRARLRAKIRSWPSNALRHSFASYHFAHFKNANELALEMGHTNSEMVFRHYRELVQPKEAARYWQIKPRRPRRGEGCFFSCAGFSALGKRSAPAMTWSMNENDRKRHDSILPSGARKRRQTCFGRG